LISELFRLSLCRNDDHNLALSSILKPIKKRGDNNKDKFISDLKSREEERNLREDAILK
jgi:hypothetical protein